MQAVIQLTTCDDTTTALETTQSDSLGKYYFRNLDAGCYRVRFTPPSNYRLCTKTKVDNEAYPDTDNDMGSDNYTGDIDLASGESDMSIDACFIRNTIETDLALTKTVDKSEVNLWDDIVYTLTVTNEGSNMATGVRVKDYWPEGLMYLSHNAIGQDKEVYDEKEAMWNIGTIDAGEEKVLTITAKVGALRNIVNIAEVYSMYEQDTDSTPNNLDEAEDDYGSVTVIPIVQVAAEGTSEPQLADTGVATSITFAVGSLLLIAAIGLEEMRGRVNRYGVRYDEEEEG